MKTFIIINPISGKERRSREEWESAAKVNFPDAAGAFTQRAGHATELAKQAVQQGYEQILVAGGDGTINEVARVLVGTTVVLGIIPKGSGNGLARELGMPLRYEEALVALQHAQPVACDVGQANAEYFFNVAGVGIEAVIAQQFAQYGKSGQRGMWPYFKLGFKSIFTYKPQTLEVQFNNRKELLAPLTLVFANGTQYGSNFIIAPKASLTDGQLDMVEVKDISKWRLALAAPTFFSKTFRPFEVTRVQHTTEALICAPGQIVYHLDGEPRVAQDKLHIKLLPKQLLLLMPTGK